MLVQHLALLRPLPLVVIVLLPLRMVDTNLVLIVIIDRRPIALVLSLVQVVHLLEYWIVVLKIYKRQ